MDKDKKEALAKAGLLEIFLNLQSSHQREYHKWINEAKKPGTRASRIAKMIEMLKGK